MKRFFYVCAMTYLSVLFFVLIVSAFFFKNLGLEQNVEAILQPASLNHLFGTDSLGRDLLLRVIQGGQISILVGLLTTACSFILAVIIGSISGWFEGTVDRVAMRLIDICMSVPGFITVSILTLFMQNILHLDHLFLKSLISLCLAISLTRWMSIARVTRTLVMETKRLPFIEAAHAVGASPWRIVSGHIFKNIRGRLFVIAALQIPSSIMYESYMSFIGLGIQAPWTSWGLLIQEGWRTLGAFPHLILFPSAVMFFSIWSMNEILDRRN